MKCLEVIFNFTQLHNYAKNKKLTNKTDNVKLQLRRISQFQASNMASARCLLLYCYTSSGGNGTLEPPDSAIALLYC